MRAGVLPAAQQRLWPKLLAVRREPFVLYGGTAIALYLGHRASVDFDFFTHQSFQPEDLLGRFSFLPGAQLLQAQTDTLTALVPVDTADGDTVKVSFFGGLTFGRLDDPEETDDRVVLVASPRDLLAHKLKVLLQRVEPKDYQDIDALLGAGLDLASALAGARALFAAFPPQECLRALTYFKDEVLRELPQALEARLIAATKRVDALPQIQIKAPTLVDWTDPAPAPSSA